MEIIIGREEGARRLHCIAGGREFNIGQAGSVPLSVSRRHCKITVNGSSMNIENIKAQNVTFVDGNQIFSKVITSTSRVQLGEEKFLVPLQQILQLVGVSSANGGNAPKEALTFSLKPMKAVWEEYHEQKLEIQRNAAKSAENQRLLGIFSMVGAFAGAAIPVARWVIMGFCIILAIYFFHKGKQNTIIQEKLDDLDEEYAKKYKCPNPACGRSFGAIPYRNIEYNKQCLACGCKYTH